MTLWILLSMVSILRLLLMEFIQAGLPLTFWEKYILIFADLPLYHDNIAYTLDSFMSADLVKALILPFTLTQIILTKMFN